MKTSYDSTSPHCSCPISQLPLQQDIQREFFMVLIFGSVPTCMETVLLKASRICVDNRVVPSAFMFSVAVTVASLKLLPLLNLAEFLLPDHRVLPVLPAAHSFASSPEATGGWFLGQGLLTFSAVLTSASELIQACGFNYQL